MKKHLRRSFVLLSALLLLLALASCVTAPVAAPGPEAQRARAAAWQALWADRFAEAEAGFKEYLKADPASADALRGLGIALFARGAVFEASEKLLAAVAAKPDAAASVAARAFVAGEMPYRESLDRRLQEADAALARAGNPPSTRRTGVRGQLWYATEVAGDPAAAKKLAAELGVVAGWKLLGPFPSISGAGFDEPFIDEAHLAAAVSRDPSAPGLDNRSLKWISPTREEPDGTIHVAQRLKGSGGCVYYGTAAFAVPADGDYWIIVDRSGALHLWIDGESAIGDPRELLGDELHWARKHLAKGDHRVVVKIADDTRPAVFRVCVERVALDASADAAATALAGLPGLLDDDADPALARLALQAGQSGQAEDRFWFAFLLADKGYARAALAQAAELRRLAGGTGPAMARIIENRAFLLLDRDDDASNALAADRSSRPAFAPAFDLMLVEALGNGRTKETERLLEDSEKSLGRRYRTDLFRVLLAAERGKDLYAKVADLRKAYPDVPEVYELLLSGGVRGYDVSGILPDLIQKRLPSRTRLAFVERLRSDGYYATAYQQAQQITPIFPSSDRLHEAALSTGYFSRNRTYAQTTADLDALLKEFPQSRTLLGLGRNLAGGYVSYLESRAGSSTTTPQQSDELSKERKRLEGYLSGLLEIDPGDFASRDTIRQLRGEERFSTLVQISDPFTAIDDYERSGQPASGDVVRVLDEEVELCFADGGTRTLRQLVLKITSRHGAGMESTQQVAVDPWRERFTIDRAIVLKSDRTRLSAKVSGTKVSFPGLEAGDYLVLSYAVDGSQSGSLRGSLWTSRALTSFALVHRADFRLIYPESAPLKVVYHNETGLEFKETRGSPFAGYQQLRIEVAGANAVGLAPALPDQRDVLAWVDVSTVRDWDSIVHWYRGLSAGRIVPTPLVDETVRGIIAGAPDNAARISRLYDFVSNKIDYEDLSFQYSAYVPQKPESVLDDRYGDCKDKCALLIAMLGSAGIESWIALSDSSYDGENTFLPSPRFNHTIVVVPKAGVGGADLLLDPTSESFTYPDLPPRLVGTWYLPISPGGTGGGQPPAGLRRVTGQEPGITDIRVEFDAGAAETAFRASGEMHGIHAARLRSMLRSADPGIRRISFALYASGGIPGVQLAEYSVSHLEDIYAPPVVEFSGKAPGCIVNGAALVIPWFVGVPIGLLDVVRAASRGAPLEVDEPFLKTPQHETCVVNLPKGARVAALPADADLRYGLARAIFRFAVRDGRVVCEREVYLPPMIVAPADLGEFESFLSAVAAKQLETVRLQVETR